MGSLAGGCQPAGGDTTDTATDEGEETTACEPGHENCECAEGASCEPGLLCASNYCIPYDMMTTSDTLPPLTSTSDTTDTANPTDSSESLEPTETGTTECDPSMVQDPVCSGATPYCGAQGTCVGCGQIDCTEVSGSTPTCDVDSGACVQCTAEAAEACSGNTPVCDAAQRCVGCTDHVQCKSGACQLETGACFTTVLHVERGATCDGATGTVEQPFCEIQDAVSTVTAADPAVVLVKGSGTSYAKQVQVAANRTVAIVRDGAAAVRLEVESLDALTVNAGAKVYLNAIQISKGDVSKGIFCNGGKVWLDKTQIVDRKGLGFEGVDCDLQARQSRVYLNMGGGLKLNGGSAHLENSYVVSNGGSFSLVAGITLSNMAKLTALYTTIADNDGKAGVEDSLDCDAPGTVALRNSILFGQSDATSVACAGATSTASVVDAMALMGEGTQIVSSLNPDWFVSPETGNFAVKAGAPFEDVAVWKAGDPATDYDGDARPGTEGDADYAGADRPK